MLSEPEMFEPLTETPWDESRVREAIRGIVADADAAFDPDGLWPAHEWDVYQSTAPLKDMYVGSSGVIWALDALRRRGYAETTLDLAAAALRTLEAWREVPDFAQWPEDLPSRAQSALLTGESGALIVERTLVRPEHVRVPIPGEPIVPSARSHLSGESGRIGQLVEIEIVDLMGPKVEGI